MKKQLLTAALCAALVCAACAPASAAAPSVAPAPSLSSAAAVAVPKLPLTVGESNVSVSAYVAGDSVRGFTATSPEELPRLADEISAQVVVTRDETTADGETKAVTVFSGDSEAFASFVPTRNDSYTYTVTPGDGDTEYRFEVETRMAPRVRLSAQGAKLGETLAVYVDYANGLAVTGKTTLSYPPKFYEAGESTMALLPISYNVAPGDYDLTVNIAGGEVADAVTQSYKITATKRDFVVQNLTVDSSTANSTINNDAANREWNEKIEPLKYVTDSQKYWSGNFIMPVQGRTTTEFGTIRYTNGSKTSSRHGALDIAAATGVPVPAANAGRVIFAQYIQMSGNVVVIEHGLGLKTWYFHMSEINVKENQMVKQGDIIGKVGATGFVTGPHLHFGMSVGPVYINPQTAIDVGIG